MPRLLSFAVRRPVSMCSDRRSSMRSRTGSAGHAADDQPGVPATGAIGPSAPVHRTGRQDRQRFPPLICCPVPQSLLAAPVTAARGRVAGLPVAVGAPSPGSGPAWAGHPVAPADLHQAGFRHLELRVTSLDVDLPGGQGCEWTTIGEVPDVPGLYAFTVEGDQQIRVVYVGLTGHLWMVAKGRLPGSGSARGGQRYGRPRHAGVTRRRVNVRIAGQLRA